MHKPASHYVAVALSLSAASGAPLVCQAQQAAAPRGALIALSAAERGSLQPQPVVLTIEGGGSLGVYEAGMTWAFVEFFKRQYPDSGWTTRADHRLRPLTLASVSGASAGSINALLAATAWCMKPDVEPEKSMFWRAWVPTGMPQLLPSFGSTGFTEGGLFSRDYFDSVVFKELKDRWKQASWPDSRRCNVPVGATITRLVPEIVPLPNASGVTARNQRLAATFEVTTEPGEHGGNELTFKRRTAGSADETNVNLPSHDGTHIEPDTVLRLFEASSGYPVAFAPLALTYSRAVGGPTTAQFSDGGVFDNGPLGLGLSVYFGRHDWPVYLATANIGKAFPFVVYVAPDNRRIWDDSLHEGLPDDADQPKLVDGNARGLQAMFQLASGFVPSARTYEMQQTIHTINDIVRMTGNGGVDAGARSPAELLFVTSRWHPIVGDWMNGFAGFLGRPFREYDFYVGMYDGLEMLATGICGQPRTAAELQSTKRCIAIEMQRFIEEQPINLGTVAPGVLRDLWTREFHDLPAVGRQRSASAAPTLGVVLQGDHGADPAESVARALVRGTSALMQDHTPLGRSREAALRRCSDTGMLAQIVCGEGLASVIDSLKSDKAAMAAISQWRSAGKAACERAAGIAISDACLSDEAFVQLLQDPTAEMDRTVQLLIERLVNTTPPGTVSAKVVAALGLMYLSTNENYRRGFDGGQTSVPRIHRSSAALWRFLPSYATSMIGAPGAYLGWELRYNATSRWAFVAPAKVALTQRVKGSSTPGTFGGDSACATVHCVAAAPIVGAAAEYKWGRWISSVRLGANYWVPTAYPDSTGFILDARDRLRPELSVFWFGGKLRTAVSRRPEVLGQRQAKKYIGEIGIGDLNGLIYWGTKLFASAGLR